MEEKRGIAVLTVQGVPPEMGSFFMLTYFIVIYSLPVQKTTVQITLINACHICSDGAITMSRKK